MCLILKNLQIIKHEILTVNLYLCYIIFILAAISK